jgi:hypothetical protein
MPASLEYQRLAKQNATVFIASIVYSSEPPTQQ